MDKMYIDKMAIYYQLHAWLFRQHTLSLSINMINDSLG